MVSILEDMALQNIDNRSLQKLKQVYYRVPSQQIEGFQIKWLRPHRSKTFNDGLIIRDR